MHDGNRNAYNFIFNNTKIDLLPNKKIIFKQDLSNYLLNNKPFIDIVTKMERIHILLGEKSHNNSKAHENVTLILEEFEDLFSNETPQGLPI